MADILDFQVPHLRKRVAKMMALLAQEDLVGFAPQPSEDVGASLGCLVARVPASLENASAWLLRVRALPWYISGIVLSSHLTNDCMLIYFIDEKRLRGAQGMCYTIGK